LVALNHFTVPVSILNCSNRVLPQRAYSAPQRKRAPKPPFAVLKQWGERRSTWRDETYHDWASHGADSLMTGAMGVSPDPEKRGEADRHRRYRGTQRTAWGI
jgi:hypothetical protein